MALPWSKYTLDVMRIVDVAMPSTQDLHTIVGFLGVVTAGLGFMIPLAITLPQVWNAGTGRRWGFPYFLGLYTCMLRFFLFTGFEPRADQSPVLTQAMIYLCYIGIFSQLICLGTFMYFFSTEEQAVAASYIASGFFVYIDFLALHVAGLLDQEFLGIVCAVFASPTMLSPLVDLPSVIEEGMERVPPVHFLAFAMGNCMVWIFFGWLGSDSLVMWPNGFGLGASIFLLSLHAVSWLREYMAPLHND